IKDLVEFSFNGSKRFGTIIIVDAFGTFRQSDEVSYDIIDLDRMVMCKHVVESDIFPPDSQVLKELLATKEIPLDMREWLNQ
ncbi:hypothetical protein ACQRAK_08100, partial [Streptococcus alactolyticus]